ncbi:beta-propeller domain-containing protein [Lachnospiraceae bacterium 29-84]
MGKHIESRQWEETVRESLRKAAEAEPIPESLHPKQMEKWLEQAEKAKGEPVPEQMEPKQMEEWLEEAAKDKVLWKRKWWYGTAALAACLAIVVLAAGRSMDWKRGVSHTDGAKTERVHGTETLDGGEGSQTDASGNGSETASAGADAGSDRGAEKTTYGELYQTFSKIWEKQEEMKEESVDVAVDDAAVDVAADADGASEGSVEMGEGSAIEAGIADSDAPDMGVAQESGTRTQEGASQEQEEDGSGDFGKTNQQEKEVEEGDILKNDGRYLYQVIDGNGEDVDGYQIQIVDTQGGLAETARIGGFGNGSIGNIYLWEDTLVAIECGWASYDGNGLEDAASGAVNEVAAVDTEASGSGSAPYSKIHIYDIKDRANPKNIHTFTVKGDYRDSRISDGYLYFFAGYDADRPKTEQEYQAYIPEMDGSTMEADRIYLPKDADTASYLVMASVNMAKPDRFIDTKAIVARGDRFYVSKENIYIADNKPIHYTAVGEQTDTTAIYRFSYQEGKIEKAAEGTVKGMLRDDFAMNEYKGYLRMVTTVQSYTIEQITDDISGEIIGYDTMDSSTTNSLYVLDPDLKVTGQIEGLAEDERIYSARFMGDSGYFVTFRETDPLFSVDLSNPKEPKILGELKISGFSEYLHFWEKDLLLGIGMEADEHTGNTEGLKISMFDISNPADVKEKSKLHLPEVDYSDALYHYKAVLADPKKNIFGFQTETYGYEVEGFGVSSEYRERYQYLVYTYENGEFRQLLSIDYSSDAYPYTVRGTYIKDTFYFMCTNGRVEAYRLTDGSKLDELVP